LLKYPSVFKLINSLLLKYIKGVFTMEYGNNFFGNEKAEGDVGSDWATAVIKVSCILIIGLIILQGVFIASNITANSAFFGAYNAVVDSVKSGYGLVSLMVFIAGAAAILHFLGFM
jgi:hypothetical protein